MEHKLDLPSLAKREKWIDLTSKVLLRLYCLRTENARLATLVRLYHHPPKSSEVKVQISGFQRVKGKGQSYAKTVINLFSSEMVSNSSSILRVPWVTAANWRLSMAKNKLRLRATITIDWVIDDLDHYNAKTLKEAAINQKEYFDNGGMMVEDILTFAENVSVVEVKPLF